VVPCGFFLAINTYSFSHGAQLNFDDLTLCRAYIVYIHTFGLNDFPYISQLTSLIGGGGEVFLMLSSAVPVPTCPRGLEVA
jgi:hypothetical protein